MVSLSGGQERSDSGMSLQQRLATVAEAILPTTHEDDGSLTVQHDGTFSSLRVVTIAEGLDMVALTQMLAWDLPLDAKLRAVVGEHAHHTLLGTVSLTEKGAATGGNSRKQASKQASRQADVLLRYNFPAAGLTDEALGTLILMVLSTGADVRRALLG